MEKEVMFCYGALSNSLEQQANSQGYTFGKESELLQKLNDSMIMCCESWVMHRLTTGFYDEQITKESN